MTHDDIDKLADVVVETIRDALDPVKEDIRSLKREVADLQVAATAPGADKSLPLTHKLAALEQQVIELRSRPVFSYEGEYQIGMFYRPGQSVVTSDGRVWLCTAPTTMKPCTGPTWVGL